VLLYNRVQDKSIQYSDCLMPKIHYASPYLPKYRRIEQDLRRRIVTGEWKVGAAVPARRALAQEFGVGLPTLEQAISFLLADGTLEAKGRMGTCVATPTGQEISSTERGTRAFRAQQTGTLGIIAAFNPLDAALPGTADENVRRIVRGMEQAFSQGHRTTRVINRFVSEGVYSSYTDAADEMVCDGADALAAITLYQMSAETDALIAAAAKSGVPTVFVTADEIRPEFPHVFIDNRYGGYCAAQHLLRQGYSPLLFVAPYAAHWVEMRIAGAKQAAEGCDLPTSVQVLWSGATETDHSSLSGAPKHNYFDTGYELIRSAISEITPGTGIVAANDRLAGGVLRALRDHGIAPGDDVGVIGFDDIAESWSLGLSTMHPPAEALGAEAVRLLDQHLSGSGDGVQVRLRPSLIARASSRPRRSMSGDPDGIDKDGKG
jgi:DNA-binding LacI/PurR family transcriptional regulator